MAGPTTVEVRAALGRVAREGGFRDDVQGLRGVAILLVVAYHVGIPGFDGGFVGVDVFFALSGYLITGLLVGEFERSGRVSLLRFSARRIRRLLPASAVVLLGTLVLAGLVYSPLELTRIARTGQSVAVYVANFLFASRATDYLGGDTAADPFLQTWSLAVEEQFYLVWPLTVAALMWFGQRRWGLRRVLVAGMTALVVGALALSVVLTSYRQPWAFFASPPRFWEFAVGGLAALVPVQWVRRRGVAPVAASAGVALVLLPAFTYGATTPFPGVAATLPVLGTVAILVAGTAGRAPTANRWLGTRVVGWFGQLSYSWYLWHWPLLVLAAVLWPTWGTGLRALVAAVALVVSSVSFHLVEQPVRHSERLLPRPGVTVVGGLLVTLLCLGAATALHSWAERRAGSGDQARFARASDDLPFGSEDRCRARFEDLRAAEDCEFGDVDSPNTVVLLGDSHAGHWFPAVEEVAERRGLRLLIRIKSACPYPDVEPFNPQLGRAYTECTTWRDRVMAEIDRERPRLVVLSSASDYVPREGTTDVSGLTLRDWAEGVRATTGALARAGVPFVVIEDVPQPGFDAPACLSRAEGAVLGAPECTFDRDSSVDGRVAALEREAAPAAGGAVLDLSEEICPRPRCRVDRGGMVLYSDDNHMTATFNRSLASVLDARLVERGVLG